MNQMTEDEALEASLAQLDQQQSEPQDSPQAHRIQGSIQESLSPTLAALEQHRRPKLATACETCPMSLWFASSAEVKCYCRAMYLITWSSKEQNQILHCDGPYLGEE